MKQKWCRSCMQLQPAGGFSKSRPHKCSECLRDVKIEQLELTTELKILSFDEYYKGEFIDLQGTPVSITYLTDKVWVVSKQPRYAGTQLVGIAHSLRGARELLPRNIRFNWHRAKAQPAWVCVKENVDYCIEQHEVTT